MSRQIERHTDRLTWPCHSFLLCNVTQIQCNPMYVSLFLSPFGCALHKSESCFNWNNSNMRKKGVAKTLQQTTWNGKRMKNIDFDISTVNSALKNLSFDLSNSLILSQLNQTLLRNG